MGRVDITFLNIIVGRAPNLSHRFAFMKMDVLKSKVSVRRIDSKRKRNERERL